MRERFAEELGAQPVTIRHPRCAECERVSRKLVVEWSKRAGPDGEAIVKAMQ
jgi:hypothetical protein